PGAPSVISVMRSSGSPGRGLGWKFYDADDYHPEENRVKMGRGIPLNDQRCSLWTACGSSLFSSEESVQRHLNTRKRWRTPEV
uniref:gluconokinase n=1 Tax=Ursus maritimus TaxID=29073 RepID=A0A452TDD6_URSMA